MRYLYAIKDALVGFGCIPNVPLIIDLANDDVARRLVQDCMADGQKPNAFNVHPEHKELYRVGSFNEVTGEISSLTPHCVARAIDFLGKEQIVNESGESSEISQEV